MGNFKIQQCADKGCFNEFKQYNSLQKYCSPKCLNNNRKNTLQLKKVYKPVKKISDKRKIENAKYNVLRLEFLGKPENNKCFIEGCEKRADTIEHTRGRKGYADEWARENKVTLYLDVRFWKPCCFYHNLELENNPDLAKQYQLSKLHGGKK